ncbi:DUF982 domain-containing protein [Rhizobium sp. GCM10022189]|uniref:DUF982 domain-containing protein n=1 Tax=Rhizobium sp. GCM10022189 TaxID=3252654 RepID=UPI00361A1CB9
MNDIAFAPIREVAVGLPDADHFSTATSVSGLMGILMSERWPKRANDTTWHHALTTCVRVIQLETDTTKARKAFVAAARDAGLEVAGYFPTTVQEMGWWWYGNVDARASRHSTSSR